MVWTKPPVHIRMATIYMDHMILQQAPASANVWGYVLKCDSKVTVTFAGKKLPANFSSGMQYLVCDRIVNL